MITENLSALKIHKLTQEQYDRELAAGNIDESALYLTPDEDEEAWAVKPLIINADDAPTTGSNSVSGIPIFTIDYSPSDLKAHADAGGRVFIVRYNRYYEMYEATDEAAKFRFVEVTDSQVDGYYAVLDTNKAMTITKTTHKARIENTSGGAVGQIPIIKSLDSKGRPSAWQFGNLPETINGANGATFTPAVDADGNLSWSNDAGLANPETVNIKGPQGKQGPAGYTPAKGTDYWTAADQKAIVDAVVARFTNVAEVGA